MQFLEDVNCPYFLKQKNVYSLVQFYLVLWNKNWEEKCKAREMFSNLPQIINSATIGLTFLLLIISTIILSKTIATLHLLPGFYSAIFS